MFTHTQAQLPSTPHDNSALCTHNNIAHDPSNDTITTTMHHSDHTPHYNKVTLTHVHSTGVSGHPNTQPITTRRNPPANTETPVKMTHSGTHSPTKHAQVTPNTQSQTPPQHGHAARKTHSNDDGHVSLKRKQSQASEEE